MKYTASPYHGTFKFEWGLANENCTNIYFRQLNLYRPHSSLQIGFAYGSFGFRKVGFRFRYCDTAY